MICCFCGRHEERDDGIEEGWIPSFWSQGKEWEGPVCVLCTMQHLFFNHEIDEFELLPGHQRPDLAIPLTKHPNT
jgi:hypothetical protein